VVVLDCVIERKTIADLASSIVDGRYGEQKHRLLDCGLHTRMYIVEGLSLSTGGGGGGGGSGGGGGKNPVSSAALKSALATTHAVHGLQVLRTRGLDHTAAVLYSIHRRVTDRFQRGVCCYSDLDVPQTPRQYMRLSEYQRRGRKKSVSTVGEAFALQMRAIPGCSRAAATALAGRFHTYAQLYSAMVDLSGREGGQGGARAMLEDVVKAGGKGGKGQRIGGKLAESVVHQLFSYY
jgi:crossover junction endonuclease MUS81